VIPGDFLQMDLSDLATRRLRLSPSQRLRIVGNLPYNIATVIIEKLLHQSAHVVDMFFMVQLEVAQRIAAMPGSRQYGYLSVDCQHHSDVHLGFKVSPACFVPRPQVSSSMISLTPKRSELDPVCEADFEAITKAAFSYRRKTLTNSLARHPVFGKVSCSLLNLAGIEGSRRAEELSVQQYELLARIYHNEFSNA
jgi:16S rRNA (adenine1518-N6/adenine1519-N6)-dimethyltransferase